MFRPPSFPHCPMTVCFVCGNAVYERNVHLLHSRNPRSRAGEPFFPFLEYHDPAPGAESMRKDWSVLSCRVCHAFLTQQWESFELTRTPVSKRLYWLKRPSGCEIRQPVSQIELEEILNEHSRDNGDDQEEFDGRESDDDALTDQPNQYKKQQEVTSDQSHNDFPASGDPQESEVALGRNKELASNYVCYSCGKPESKEYIMCRVHCKPSYEQMRCGVPFFPTILSSPAAKGAKVICDSITFMCTGCLAKCDQKWHSIQEDFADQNTSQSVLPRIPLPEMVLCYVCSSSISTKYNDHLVHSSKFDSKNSIFDELKQEKCEWGRVSLNFGFTYVCESCQLSILGNLEKSKQKVLSGSKISGGNKSSNETGI